MIAKLPVTDILPELRAQLASHPAVVLAAPPGSGKTTVAPLALLDEPWLGGQGILMLEPRRLAARLAASFMAASLGEEVGARVGYQVRFESRVSPATRLAVMTSGVLIRRLQDDPELSGVGLVIFDEFHERGLQADLALALCREVMAGLRDDLRLLVMSATLDTGVVSSFLGQAPVVIASGQSFPVEVAHWPPAKPTGQHGYSSRDTASRMAEAIRRGMAEQPGDLLAFLPGTGEIRLAAELLTERLPQDIVVHSLHGDLALAEQAAAVRPDRQGRRRVILATSIAETSLTIEGIHTVVDSGWRRVSRFDPNSGLSRLATQRISRAAAIQRAGRAGRLGPGHCIRLWGSGEEHGLLAFDPPEIQEADLGGLVLELVRWGVSEPASLQWLTPPPPGNVAQAKGLLQRLGALDDQARITSLGQRMAMLPAEPRLAAILLAGQERGAPGLACDLAALLSERDILRGRERSADLEERLRLLARFREKGATGLRAMDGDPDGCRRVDQVSRQFRTMLAGRTGSAGSKGILAAELLAAGFPDRLARRRPGGLGQYKLANGRGARLAGHDPLAGVEYLVVADLDAGSAEGRIFLAAPLAASCIPELFASRLAWRQEVAWDDGAGAVRARRVCQLDQLTIESVSLARPDDEAVRGALIEGIRRHGLTALPWSEAATELRCRLASLRCWQADGGWPEVSEEYLLAGLEQWLAPFLDGMRSLTDLRRLDLAVILGSLLDYAKRRELDRLAPTHLEVPSGSRLRLAYCDDGQPPVLAVRLQEMFGLADTPAVCDGRVKVLLHLLSPARRPIQITTDLRGFWDNAYHEVKKELKGRYPKHHWPDDPWSAQATARTKPRR
ncbi:MAG: ATP-dependent helicase HrpB [Thermodesulfobacteriota bacterium]